MSLFVLVHEASNGRIMLDANHPLDDRLAEFKTFTESAGLDPLTGTHQVLAVAGPTNPRHAAAIDAYGITTHAPCATAVIAGAVAMLSAVELLDEHSTSCPGLFGMIALGFVTEADWAAPIASAERVTYAYLNSIIPGFGEDPDNMTEDQYTPLVAVSAGLAVAMAEARRTAF